VRVLVNGQEIDKEVVRQASHPSYGRLLEAGVRVFGYDRTMLHAKVLLEVGHSRIEYQLVDPGRLECLDPIPQDLRAAGCSLCDRLGPMPEVWVGGGLYSGAVLRRTSRYRHVPPPARAGPFPVHQYWFRGVTAFPHVGNRKEDTDEPRTS